MINLICPILADQCQSEKCIFFKDDVCGVKKAFDSLVKISFSLERIANSM